jgi:predicted transcriptional regulator with HTH domain
VRKALNGGSRFTADNAQSSGRDFAFELYVAAYFSNANCVIDWKLNNDEPDVFVEISGQTLIAECKRPRVVQKIEKNIKGALSQLKSRYEKYPEAFGIGVISLEKCLNPQLKYWQVDLPQQAEALAQTMLHDAVKSYRRFWQSREQDHRTLGLIFLLNLPVAIGREKVMCNVHQSLVWQFGAEKLHALSLKGHTFGQILSSFKVGYIGNSAG